MASTGRNLMDLDQPYSKEEANLRRMAAGVIDYAEKVGVSDGALEALADSVLECCLEIEEGST